MSGGNAHAGVAARGGVGRRTPLIDGIEKVTGRARYTADLPLGPALVGRILAGVACALRLSGGAVAELRVALTGTNSQPLLLQGTEALVGKPLDEAALAALGKLVHKQVSPMRTTVTPSNYRRLVAAVHAQRLLRDLAAMPAPN
ncbi:MAG: hypothetical protein Q7S90_02250 [Rubrivivax sp.]|nr:hypothetical protein [Rubrivivax sp.]